MPPSMQHQQQPPLPILSTFWKSVRFLPLEDVTKPDESVFYFEDYYITKPAYEIRREFQDLTMSAKIEEYLEQYLPLVRSYARDVLLDASRIDTCEGNELINRVRCWLRLGYKLCDKEILVIINQLKEEGIIEE